MVVPLTRETPYDPLTDFIPLYAGISASNAHYVAKDSPYTTFEEFLEVAKANKLSMGVNNLCAPLNLSAVQMPSEFWLEFKTIALKTVPATLAGLIGGQVDVAVGQVASIHAYGDEIRPLIILDNTRKPYYEVDLPGVRTIGEAFPGKTAGTWVHGVWPRRRAHLRRSWTNLWQHPKPWAHRNSSRKSQRPSAMTGHMA